MNEPTLHLDSSGGASKITSVLFFKEALLETGWASDVRIGLAGDVIAFVEPSTQPAVGDERHAIGLPGMPNLHSHAFQRAMAGLAEVRGPDHDSFWSWREIMYRFALAMSAEDVQAVAGLLYAEMLEAGFTRVGEFHYLHHDCSGTPYGDPAEMAGRIVAAAGETGIGLTLLPVFYAHANFGGKPPNASRASSKPRAKRRRSTPTPSSASPPTAFGQSLPANSPRSSRSLRTDRSTFTWRSKFAKLRIVSLGRVAVQSNGSSTTRHSIAVGVSFTQPT
jgi:formimidoylglutamate deiminase